MKVYIDSNYRCHADNQGGTLREVEHPFFDGKCRTFIEGYCYDDCNGYVQIYPFKPYDRLAAAQTQYEADLAEAANAYQEGVDSV